MKRFSREARVRRTKLHSALVLLTSISCGLFFGGCQSRHESRATFAPPVQGAVASVNAESGAERSAVSGNLGGADGARETSAQKKVSPPSSSSLTGESVSLVAANAGVTERNVALRAAPVSRTAIGGESVGMIDVRAAQFGLPDFQMLIESTPSGAQIVVDGLPLAKTPCVLLMTGSPTGFCVDAFSVKARFIATDAGQQSQTVEELFTKHDKIPARLRFTIAGATRTLGNE